MFLLPTPPVVQLTSQEAVQLHEELEVDIVALGGLAVVVPHVVTVEIDTHFDLMDKEGVVWEGIGGMGCRVRCAKSVRCKGNSVRVPRLYLH